MNMIQNIWMGRRIPPLFEGFESLLVICRSMGLLSIAHAAPSIAKGTTEGQGSTITPKRAGKGFMIPFARLEQNIC